MGSSNTSRDGLRFVHRASLFSDQTRVPSLRQESDDATSTPKPGDCQSGETRRGRGTANVKRMLRPNFSLDAEGSPVLRGNGTKLGLSDFVSRVPCLAGQQINFCTASDAPGAGGELAALWCVPRIQFPSGISHDKDRRAGEPPIGHPGSDSADHPLDRTDLAIAAQYLSSGIGSVGDGVVDAEIGQTPHAAGSSTVQAGTRRFSRCAERTNPRSIRFCSTV